MELPLTLFLFGPHDPAVSQDPSHGLPSAQYESQLKARGCCTLFPAQGHKWITSLTGNGNHCSDNHTMAQTPSQSPFPTQSVEDRGSNPARSETRVAEAEVCQSLGAPHY